MLRNLFVFHYTLAIYLNQYRIAKFIDTKKTTVATVAYLNARLNRSNGDSFVLRFFNFSYNSLSS